MEDKKIKIIHIISSLEKGGAQGLLFEIIQNANIMPTNAMILYDSYTVKIINVSVPSIGKERNLKWFGVTGKDLMNGETIEFLCAYMKIENFSLPRDSQNG